MTREELEQKATFRGNLMVEEQVHRINEYPSKELVPNLDITYYFDKDMVEIGYYTKYNKTVQLTHGRKWDAAYFRGLQIKIL